MQLGGSAYRVPCVACAIRAKTLGDGAGWTCDRAIVEGAVVDVQRRQIAGAQGATAVVDMRLQTPDGPCLLTLAKRFAYLADGLDQATHPVRLRAYHLRPSGDGIPPRFLSSAETLVVLEPDWLIDVTALAGIDYCLRQWLASRLAARRDTLPKLRGTVVHNLFQQLSQGATVADDALDAALGRSALSLALLGETSASLRAAVQPHLERLEDWFRAGGRDLLAPRDDLPCYESTLLSPELGLRGRIDLAFRRVVGSGPPPVTRIVELKTARYNEQYPDPEAQVRGYYAILASQGRLAPDFVAHVVYTGGARCEARAVPCGPADVERIVYNRNQAVLALLLGHARPAGGSKCRKSVARADCVALSQLLSLDHCHGRDLADAAAGGPALDDAGFYADQYRLLRLEREATSRELAALWRATPEDRELSGLAVPVEPEEAPVLVEGRWHYTLRCENRSELRAGELVLLSDGDPVRGEVCVGMLLEAGTRRMLVACAEPIASPRLVDRYNSGDVLDRIVRGLHAWLQAPRGLREAVYGLRAPRATGEIVDCEQGAARGAPCAEMSADVSDVAGLNERQVHALRLALQSPDYLLVQGPPGTGKTHLIARMVSALVARGERVLIASWTNQAVDTVVQQLLGHGFDRFIRLGSPRALDPSLLAHALVPHEPAASPERAVPLPDAGAAPGPGAPGSAAPSCSSPCYRMEDGHPEPVRLLAARLAQTPVLAGTVSWLSDPNVQADRLRCDVVILDEAAQLSLAAATGVLRLAPRFILVGDDQQLPPVVQSEEAAREGLSQSPFAHLRPDAQAAGLLVTLNEQYRMHEAIAAWSSAAFYAGALIAHPAVAERVLPVEGDDPPIGWGAGVLPARAWPVVLVDAGPSVEREIALAARAVPALLARGVPARAIGVVAPFRSTVAALRRLLDAHPEATGCTVDTVDRFQGGQREAMVVCLGLGGIGRRGHAFVDDPRRLNVAFTRARAKLIVIGDLSRAAELPTLAGFLAHCREQGVPEVPGYRSAAAVR